MSNYTNRPGAYGYKTLASSYRLTNGSGFTAPAPIWGILGYETKSGTSVPFWRQKIEKRINASSPYFRTWYKAKQGGYIDVEVKGPPGGIIATANTRGYYGTGLDSLTDIYGDKVTDDIALSKIKRKIQSDKGDFAALTNVLQDVYELRRTIVGTFEGIRDLLRDVERITRHGIGGNRRHLLPQIASLYLAWVFGINPTIHDAKDLAASIDSFLKRKDQVHRYQAGHYRDSFNSRVSHINPTYGITLEVVEAIYRRYYVSYTSGHVMRLLTGNDYGVVQHFHLAPQDFVPALWEWLPWSWLFDYVFTMQAFLEDMFQSELDTSIYNVRGVKQTKQYRCHINVIPGNGYSITRLVNHDRVISSGTFNRTPIAALPGRMFRFHTMYEINNNLSNKLANVIAVLLTRNRSRRV